MGRRYMLLCLIAITTGLALTSIGQERANSTASPNGKAPASAQGTGASPTAIHTSAATNAASDAAEKRALRLEGEKRFRTNCGRCHQPPHKFPPRVMATAIRHMRVRAMITDEDMRLILGYMTQ